MQGLITLDFGNSNPHAGLFQKSAEKWELLKVVLWDNLAKELDGSWMSSENSQIVLCSVKSREEELFSFLQKGFLLTRVRDYWRGEKFAGMPVNYAKSLGEDRLIEAHYLYKTERIPILIVDAGTYVTLDIVDGTGLQGGYIIPGVNAYFSSFQQGEQLKSLSLNMALSEELPQGTLEAMRDSYTAFGSLSRELIRKRGIKKVIITGGAASLWRSFFVNEDVEMKIEPHLIHLALQHWMATQIRPL